MSDEYQLPPGSISMAKPPETFSLALSNSNKVTIGFRSLPITAKDAERVQKFLALLFEEICANPSDPIEQHRQAIEAIESFTGAGNAARVLRGHHAAGAATIPTDADLAKASENVQARENAIWIRMNQEEKVSKMPYPESENNSQG